ncbi:hypothetical protein H1R20_g15962, partial [Candolleomyces eurysporus]
MTFRDGRAPQIDDSVLQLVATDQPRKKKANNPRTVGFSGVGGTTNRDDTAHSSEQREAQPITKRRRGPDPTFHWTSFNPKPIPLSNWVTPPPLSDDDHDLLPSPRTALSTAPKDTDQQPSEVRHASHVIKQEPDHETSLNSLFDDIAVDVSAASDSLGGSSTDGYESSFIDDSALGESLNDREQERARRSFVGVKNTAKGKRRAIVLSDDEPRDDGEGDGLSDYERNQIISSSLSVARGTPQTPVDVSDQSAPWPTPHTPTAGQSVSMRDLVGPIAKMSPNVPHTPIKKGVLSVDPRIHQHCLQLPSDCEVSDRDWQDAYLANDYPALLPLKYVASPLSYQLQGKPLIAVITGFLETSNVITATTIGLPQKQVTVDAQVAF